MRKLFFLLKFVMRTKKFNLKQLTINRKIYVDFIFSFLLGNICTQEN